MKGAILAAGSGENLYPYTANVPKAMLSVMGKPLLEYTIDRLKAHKITEITIVVGPFAEQIRSYFKSGDDFGVALHYKTQEQKGIDGAVLALAGDFAGEDLFVLTHTDIIADYGLLTRTLNAVDNLGADMGVAVALQKEIQDFGVVTLNSRGLVKEVYPSGEAGKGNYVVAGTFVLSGKIFTYLQKGIPFNQCFNAFIKDGGTVAGGIWNDRWVDVGHPWDLLRATDMLLGGITETRIHPSAEIAPTATLSGPIVIEEGVKILNGAVIRGPVHLRKGCMIGNNSLIRDGTVIGEHSIVGMSCEIKHSILDAKATIARLSYIGDSIVGRKAVVHAGCVTVNQHIPTKDIVAKINGTDHIVPLPKFGAIIGPKAYIGPQCTMMPGVLIDEQQIIKPGQILE